MDFWLLLSATSLGFVIGMITGHNFWNWETKALNRELLERNQRLIRAVKWYQEQNEVFRLFNRWDNWEDHDAK